MRLSVTLRNAQTGHAAFGALWQQIKPMLAEGKRLHVEVKTETRSIAQNSRMWAMLADVSRQVDWHGRKLTSEEWKTVFTAALKRQEVIPGIDGGFVVLGTHTSQMTVGEMSDLMELMSAFGAQHGVRFSAPEYEEQR